MSFLSNGSLIIHYFLLDTFKLFINIFFSNVFVYTFLIILTNDFKLFNNDFDLLKHLNLNSNFILIQLLDIFFSL